ncbi:hypothetical protein IW262DRAFT_1365441 [Armillaria fumosa]|nr:hypothetical protein IW262DRAFT_1365441 [Armillaria fumosa]
MHFAWYLCPSSTVHVLSFVYCLSSFPSYQYLQFWMRCRQFCGLLCVENLPFIAAMPITCACWARALALAAKCIPVPRLLL